MPNRGRFLPGHNRPGPGRPPRAVEESYVQAIKTAVPPDTVIALLRKLLHKALTGNGAESRKCAEAVLKVVCGTNTPLSVEIEEKLEEMRQAIEGLKNEREQNGCAELN